MDERRLEQNKKAAAFSLGGVVHEHGLTKFEYVSLEIYCQMMADTKTDMDQAPTYAEWACLAAEELFKEWEKRK